MTDPEFDARFHALRELPPPDGLAEHTLAAVDAERRRGRTRPVPRPALYAGLAAAAGLLLAVPLLWSTGEPDRAAPEDLVPKGEGVRPPTLDVRGAVRKGETVERIAAGVRYAAGDTLLFRVHPSVPMHVKLLRNGQLIWQGPVPAGESDLPVGYTLEAGESAAVFLVEGEGVSAAVSVAEVAR